MLLLPLLRCLSIKADRWFNLNRIPEDGLASEALRRLESIACARWWWHHSSHNPPQAALGFLDYLY